MDYIIKQYIKLCHYIDTRSMLISQIRVDSDVFFLASTIHRSALLIFLFIIFYFYLIFFPYTFDLIIRLDGVDIHFSLLLLYILIVTHVEELPSGVGTRLGVGVGGRVSACFFMW